MSEVSIWVKVPCNNSVVFIKIQIYRLFNRAGSNECIGSRRDPQKMLRERVGIDR
jgi:hypothetical protein